MASQILASFMIQVKAVRLYSVQVAVWLGYQYSFFETPQTRMIAIRWRSPFRYSVPTMLQGKQSKREYVYTGTCACTINQPVECSQVRKQCTIILQWTNMQSVLLTTLSYSCIVSAPYSSYPAGNRSWRYSVTDVCVQVRGPWNMLPNGTSLIH